MLKIVNAWVIVTCPGRNFVALKIETDNGTTKYKPETVLDGWRV